ncbi:hypothetical protein [Paenibacillus donghaensis]|uniref:SprT-like domain-containing protein n=1 Tax=Paenibacillus donghaensis TaxID=414771 RepID=A0A2Z2K8U9_9BACL|nr:hypothetical protein [Paenibacillus donghaensis]ASA21804.1 hypothetical protein B9T62_14100 [Paenibacillus donghaensis]
MHYVSIEYDKDVFSKDNYRIYSEKDFILLVESLAKESNILTIPPINFYDMKPIGFCEIVKVDSIYQIYQLGFDRKLLDGKSFTTSQIEDVVKHELSHLIATLHHNDDCKHDSRWEQIALKVGCNPSPYACLTQLDIKLKINSIPQPSKQYFILRCKKCRQIIKETNVLSSTFHFFLLSESNLPFHLGQITAGSECCQASYIFEARADSMIRQLKKSNELVSLQEYLTNFIDTKNSL